MRRIAAALTLTALVLAGCGGDDTTDEPTADQPADEQTTDTPDAPAEDGGDGGDDEGQGGACPYLTTAALDDAFGATFEEVAGNETGCSFDDGAGLSIQLSRIDIAIDPEQYAEESTASCDEGSVVEVEAGDRAYACLAIGPTATVFEGAVAINLGVLSADDEQAVLDGFVATLPSISVP